MLRELLLRDGVERRAGAGDPKARRGKPKTLCLGALRRELLGAELRREAGFEGAHRGRLTVAGDRGAGRREADLLRNRHGKAQDLIRGDPLFGRIGRKGELERAIDTLHGLGRHRSQQGGGGGQGRGDRDRDRGGLGARHAPAVDGLDLVEIDTALAGGKGVAPLWGGGASQKHIIRVLEAIELGEVAPHELARARGEIDLRCVEEAGRAGAVDPVAHVRGLWHRIPPEHDRAPQLGRERLEGLALSDLLHQGLAHDKRALGQGGGGVPEGAGAGEGPCGKAGVLTPSALEACGRTRGCRERNPDRRRELGDRVSPVLRVAGGDLVAEVVIWCGRDIHRGAQACRERRNLGLRGGILRQELADLEGEELCPLAGGWVGNRLIDKAPLAGHRHELAYREGAIAHRVAGKGGALGEGDAAAGHIGVGAPEVKVHRAAVLRGGPDQAHLRRERPTLGQPAPVELVAGEHGPHGTWNPEVLHG